MPRLEIDPLKLNTNIEQVQELSGLNFWKYNILLDRNGSSIVHFACLLALFL